MLRNCDQTLNIIKVGYVVESSFYGSDMRGGLNTFSLSSFQFILPFPQMYMSPGFFEFCSIFSFFVCFPVRSTYEFDFMQDS